VLVSGRRVPRDIGGLALEEVGHEHAVFLLIRVGQDVGTLNGLVEETEDV
jgi:tetrahydromethanopterin S-methyltransferase subunit G